MNNRNYFSLFSAVLCFSLAIKGFSLPKDPQIVSGSCEFNQIHPNIMEVRPTDKTIIDYSKFDIKKNEKVKFIQKSPSSCVLNRVQGADTSQILGSLESNGKVFLVNTNGIYFGPESSVNVGSFIASTLDIANEDFLQEKYLFSFKGKDSVIKNEGSLTSIEGSIALIGTHVQNFGLISARVGSVVLASAEHITLDFTGDGLLQFSVEGTLKESLIEQLGHITGANVSLKIPAAKKAISEIVNMDGAEVGDIFIEENGTIKFASEASIESKKIMVEAAHLEIKGSCSAISSDGKGGEVQLLGKEVVLEGALIDASGAFGGGTVLIGGEYQGGGNTPWASKVKMDEDSLIFSNALEKGNGGVVVLWSKDHTDFRGTIFAQGGNIEGNGGIVETSSLGDLDVNFGHVNTLSKQGEAGNWLLDPGYVYIASNTSGQPICTEPLICDSNCNGFCYIALSTIENATSNVSIIAHQFYLQNSINMVNFGVGIEFIGCSNCSGYPTISPSLGALNIQTNGGNITFTNIELFLAENFILTTNNGNIIIPSVESETGFPGGLTINAGTGVVKIDCQTQYNEEFLTYLNINSASEVQSSVIKTGSGGFYMPTTTTFTPTLDTVTIDTSSGNGPINLGNVNSSSASLILQAGTGAITLANSIVIDSFTASSGSSIKVGSMYASSGDINLNVPVKLNASSCTISAAGGDITFSSTLGVVSSSSLTLEAGGVITLPSSSSSLSNLAINSASLVNLGSVYTTAGGINITPLTNLVQSSTILSATGGNVYLSGGVSATGQNLTLYSTDTVSLENLNGVGDLTITAHTIDLNSSIAVEGNLTIGNSNPFILNAGELSAGGDFSQTGVGTFTLEDNISAQGSTSFAAPLILGANASISGYQGISFQQPISANATGLSLTLNSGTQLLTVPPIGTVSIPFSSVSMIGGTINLETAPKTSFLTINNSSTLNITAEPISILGSFQQIGAGSTTLEQNITAGSVSFLGNLTLKADTITIAATAGDLSFKGISESNSNIQTLNLQATGLISTSSTLSTNILSIPSAPIGVSIGNYLTLTDGCSITALTGNISIAGDLELKGASGTITLLASAGNISIGGDVVIEGASGVASFTANSGTVDIGNQLKATSFTISAENVTVSNGISFVETGSITATGSVSVVNSISTSGDFTIVANDASFKNLTTEGGDISVDAYVTIKGSEPIISSAGGDIVFTQPIVPDTSTENLTIDAQTGDVTVSALGSSDNPFEGITVIGCSVSIGDYYVSGDFEVENCAELVLPSKVLSVNGDFIQSGVGPVSLAYNITAGRVLYFAGLVTITENLTLTGFKGIDLEGTIFAGEDGLSLAINAPSSLVVLHNIGTSTIPFKRVSIIGNSVAFKGVVSASILEFNGAIVENIQNTAIEKLYNMVPKSNLFVPGLYSSWNTFFDDDYFQITPVNFSNPE